MVLFLLLSDVGYASLLLAHGNHLLCRINVFFVRMRTASCLFCSNVSVKTPIVAVPRLLIVEN